MAKPETYEQDREFVQRGRKLVDQLNDFMVEAYQRGILVEVVVEEHKPVVGMTEDIPKAVMEAYRRIA